MVPLGGERLHEAMYQPYKDGWDAKATFDELNPVAYDDGCQEIESAVSFFRELKKQTTALSLVIVMRITAIENQLKKNELAKKIGGNSGEEKSYKIVGPKIIAQADELKKFVENKSLRRQNN